MKIAASPFSQASFLLILGVFLQLATVKAESYVPPAGHRSDILLDSNWRFAPADVAGASATGFDDNAWKTVALPHTWNNLDGEDGGDNYRRGIGWYRTSFNVGAGQAGHQFFLKFDGAFSVTKVWLNGVLLGEHQGGFAAFVFDATSFIHVGRDNSLAVEVSNAANRAIPPLAADFTFFGGIYRDVHLLVTDPVQISPLDYGSPGVYLKTTEVSRDSANLQVTTLISNALDHPKAVTLRTVVMDANSNVVTCLTNETVIPAETLSRVQAQTTVANPHLWNGLGDPYLYHTSSEVIADGEVVDAVVQPLGFRSFRIDPSQGFFLNGQYYDLHGVCLHQDWQDCGWALTEAQRQTNFLLLKEIGATAVRLSHYQNADRIYQMADASGIILWTEIPLIDRITESPEFYANAKQQLKELIRQNYNHPSIICWSIFNEITLEKGPAVTNLISQLAALEATEDPTRPSTCAIAGKSDQPCNWLSQVCAFNKYSGWYSASMQDFGPWIDKAHEEHPTRCIGISEYGAGGSIYQHSEDPVAKPAPKGPFHPEEYEDEFHEAYWPALKARPYLWCKFLWNMVDFAVDSRQEGDTAGRNDKGLITYDRQVRKDAFYWYKANWTTNPMVYITGHTFTNRTPATITAKVYSNCGTAQLFLNGVSQGEQSGTNCLFKWPLTLAQGTNAVRVVAHNGDASVSDELVWIHPARQVGGQ